jgi:histidine triad (HIT) family protein
VTDCTFCRIVRRQAPALIVHETPTVMAFLPLKMEVVGHTAIVPAQHYCDLYDVSDQVLSDVVIVARALAVRYRQKLGATGTNLLLASGADAQQSVPHLHFHLLLPRFPDDGLDAWPNLPHLDIDREQIHRAIVA